MLVGDAWQRIMWRRRRGGRKRSCCAFICAEDVADLRTVGLVFLATVQPCRTEVEGGDHQEKDRDPAPHPALGRRWAWVSSSRHRLWYRSFVMQRSTML